MAEITNFRIEGGKAKGFDAKGNLVKTIGEAGVREARIEGRAITLSYETGKTKVYDLKGKLKKIL